MKQTNKQSLLAVAGLVTIIVGLLLVSSVVYAQVGGLNLVPASGSDQNITLNPNDFPYYTFTVNAENPTTFAWQLDGATVWPDNPYDSNIVTGTSSYTLDTISLSTGIHVLVCAQTDFGDSVTFDITIVRPGVPTPTPVASTPTPSPYQTATPNPFATPTPNPFATPTPAPTSIIHNPIPIPKDTTTQIIYAVFGFALIGAGSMAVWFRKLV